MPAGRGAEPDCQGQEKGRQVYNLIGIERSGNRFCSDDVRQEQLVRRELQTIRADKDGP